tara:strand:- start:1454 stop:1762 length:309 start_codon:yes stop_codon:yes gene_type:complete
MLKLIRQNLVNIFNKSDKDNNMPFTTIKTNQKAFLENYLRGTGKSLTAADANARFGIQKLPARMSEFRSAGLNVKVTKSSKGTARYSVSARDVTGSRAKMFA